MTLVSVNDRFTVTFQKKAVDKPAWPIFLGDRSKDTNTAHSNINWSLIVTSRCTSCTCGEVRLGQSSLSLSLVPFFAPNEGLEDAGGPQFFTHMEKQGQLLSPYCGDLQNDAANLQGSSLLQGPTPALPEEGGETRCPISSPHEPRQGHDDHEGRRNFFPFAPEDLQLHHHNEGAVHWLNKDEGVFSFLKIPRECVLDKVNENNTAKVVQALELLQKTESNTKRSKGKTGVSSCKAKYTVFGVKAHQGRHGFVHDKISKIQKYFKQTCALKKFVRRLEDIAAEFVPTSWLRAIAKANKCEAWPTVAGGFVAAMASSINYWAPAHKDEDFLFSIHQVNIVGQLHSTDIVQYFCFPTLGFAIGLCPGDVILFNPHVHHCLSAKSPRYEDVDVHVTTMYVKTAHAGLNNNSIPLTEEQETYYSINLH